MTQDTLVLLVSGETDKHENVEDVSILDSGTLIVRREGRSLAYAPGTWVTAETIAKRGDAE